MAETNKMSRRRFLVVAGGAVGASVLCCGGLAGVGLRPPAVEFPETSCGTQAGRILIAYASRAGSTGGVAQAIAEALCQAGGAVDVKLAKHVKDMGSYRAVVVGSAAYMGRWMPDAAELLEEHQELLSGLPVACFTVCITMKDDTAANRVKVAAYLDPVLAKAPQVKPVDHGLFAGALDGSKLAPIYRLAVRGMDMPEGDYRNWDAIRAWATGLAPILVGG